MTGQHTSEIVGYRVLDGRGAGSFSWRDGEFHDLNPLLGNNTFAVAVNDRSEVIGSYQDEQFQQRSFLWRRGKVTLIQTDSGQVVESVSDINNRREVLISARDPQDVVGFFVWQDGQLTRLEPPPCCPGFEDGTSPVRLNDRGAVVGTGNGPAGFIPVLWEDGTLMQIQLPQGAVAGGTSAINDRGVVVGTADFPGRAAGYVWQHGQAIELGPPSGFVNTHVFDLNNRGAIVGLSSITSDQPVVATLWPRRGDPVNLNTLIADDDPLKPFVHLIAAVLINDRDVIVATGTDSRNPPFSRSSYLVRPQH